jgi:hypothetical protein
VGGALHGPAVRLARIIMASPRAGRHLAGDPKALCMV